MARKRKKATRRRRRVGAMALSAKSPLVMYGSMGLGFVAGDTINEQIDKVTGTMDGKVVGGITAGVGAGLVFMKLGKKKTVVEVAAGGILVGAGAKRLLKEFGVLNGIGRRRRVNGYGQVDVVSGYGQVDVLSGYSPNRNLNGFQVPVKPPQIMGSTATARGSGSGITNSGSEMMAA